MEVSILRSNFPNRHPLRSVRDGHANAPGVPRSHHGLAPGWRFPERESTDARMACAPSPTSRSATLDTEEAPRAPGAPKPTAQPSLISDAPQKTGVATPDLRAAPLLHKTTVAAPIYGPPLHESTLLAPPTTSRGAPIVGPSARAPCAPAAPPPVGPPPAQGPAPPPVATPTHPPPIGAGVQTPRSSDNLHKLLSMMTGPEDLDDVVIGKVLPGYFGHLDLDIDRKDFPFDVSCIADPQGSRSLSNTFFDSSRDVLCIRKGASGVDSFTLGRATRPRRRRPHG